MQRSWHSYFDLGIVMGMIFPETGGGEGPILARAKQLAADDFFSVIEMTRVKDPTVRQDVKRLAELSGVKLGFRAQSPLLGGGFNLASLDENARKAAVQHVKESMDQALEMGCVVFSLMDGRNSYPGEAKKQEAIDAFENSLRELFDYARAQAHGDPLPITLEQFDQTIDKRSLIGRTDDAVALAMRMRDAYPGFGLLVDQGHLPLLYVQPEEVFRAVGDLTYHVDVGNAVRTKGLPNYGDNHPRWDFPGGVVGVGELREFLRALANSGFFARKSPTPRPIVTMEIKPFQDEDPDAVLAGSKRIFQEAWNTF